MNVLVAGIGNLFLGDDGFGPEVVRRLIAEGPPAEGVRIVDYGIRGVHLAYDLLDGVDLFVLVDALPGEETPGELVVLEVGPGDFTPAEFDAHAMTPGAVLGVLTRIGGTLPPTYVVGCRVDVLDEAVGLTPRVEAAVPRAMAEIRALIARAQVSPAPVGGS
ncbi:hydrogenase maturation protease [Paractinoplanes durhamensis]|uniref:Peptidase M52 n=1 Tax=Paractinoplanes durhamensis TaxID=113563 RepID=A0ABQ3YZK9_9ACTN|nr:hydrogenase maturation protease [Actinoplanes durhamensis]GIE02729.1 peptidase M52 [Actinoplanes durhamensis]